MKQDRATPPGGAESAYAWVRLGVAVLISTIGGVGIWSVVVVLPTLQAEFAVARGDAALPYTVSMLCIMIGAIPMGRLADRYGVFLPATIGGLALGCGYVLSSLTTGLWQFTLVQGLLIGLLGSSATFGPLNLPFDGLVSLYLISALFGLSQGGIVPSYAVIVRAYFPPREAGTWIGLALAANLGGMALGGWLSGVLYDLTGSYQAAFLNGVAWNLLHVAIALWLVLRARRSTISLSQRERVRALARG